MKVVHLNGLRALEATLRTGSFRAAADELGVTAAAVGQRIRTLEDYLGCQLFLRTHTGVKPTDIAIGIERKLTGSFTVLENVIQQLQHPQSPNRVSVTLPASFAENWFAERLPGFYRLNSEIDLRINASNRMVDLLTEDFDFAIRYSQPPPDIYDESELFGDFVLPVCTPEFAHRHQLNHAQKSLQGVPLIHLGVRTPDPDWADWEQWAAKFDFQLGEQHESIHLSEFNSGIQPAILGQGLVLCGIAEAYSAIQTGQLIAPFGWQPSCSAGHKYWLVSVKGRKLSELQCQFRLWVIELAEEFRGELAELQLKTKQTAREYEPSIRQ